MTAVFSLATMFIFARPVFTAWSAAGECDFAGFTTISDSETFPDEASCRAYVARGDGICREEADAAGYSFLAYTTFTLTQDCVDDTPTCNGANEYYSDGQCFCNPGYWLLNNTCETYDFWCRATYGANIHAENEGCVCDNGYTFSGGRCITQDEACQRKYGTNFHAEGDRCICDTGYWFLNDACVTYDQWCSATYGENSHEENGQCISGSQPVQDPTPPPQSSPILQSSTPPPPQKIINIKKTPTSPAPTNNPDKKTPPPIYLEPPRKISEEEKAVILEWLKSRGFGPEDIKNIDDADMWYLTTSPLFKELHNRKSSAEEKYNKADLALSQAIDDRSIYTPETLENIRKMFLDAWFDNPNNKKTNLMMAMLEREKGNGQTADIYQKFAYSSLNKSERNALSSGVENAKIITYNDIFSSLETEERQQEVARTQQEQELKKSSLMNKIKSEINDEIAYAQETTKQACYKISACDWAYAKKVEIMTKAENFSQKVSDLMNDPIKAIFGIDRKKIKKEIYGQ